jgi:hypothetical protein
LTGFQNEHIDCFDFGSGTDGYFFPFGVELFEYIHVSVFLLFMLTVNLTVWPNQSPEPTAVGDVRSAIAVHAASRRWLSFFR